MKVNSDSSLLVFKRNLAKDMGETTLTPEMLEILMALDGKKNLAEVKDSLDISIPAFKDSLNKLYKLKLVVRVDREEVTSWLGRAFFTDMNTLLADTVGPISTMLISDTVENMGYRPEIFPSDQGELLIEKVSENLFDEKKKYEFITTMNEKFF